MTLENSKYFDVIVIGGGAAGLMAAGKAAENGEKTLLLEKTHRFGHKLSITGKGRCNITNKAHILEFLDRFGKNKKFLRQAFHCFFNDDLISFFEQRKVSCKVERGLRVFPESDNALEVVNALINWAHDNGARLQKNVAVKEIFAVNNQVSGVRIIDSTNNNAMPHKEHHETIYHSSKIILATGGASYPATGSTGDGYVIAKQLGHTIAPILPALVPLETQTSTASRLQGLSLKNVLCKIYINQKKQAEEFGEMIFTHFGVSGPIILSLSKLCVESIKERKTVSLSIDLKPALDEKKLNERIIRDLNNHGKMQLKTVLKQLLPNKMIPVVIDIAKINPDKICHQITGIERKRIVGILKDFRLDISKSRSFSEAIITTGGIQVNEINPRTMESLLIKGLFFAGEIIDIDADTGGFNLQAAFSTGWLAGVSSTKKTISPS
jgi:predicted Rossmann fold flavoprotein